MYVARRRKGKEGGDWDLQFTIYMTQDHVQWMLAASSSVMSASWSVMKTLRGTRGTMRSVEYAGF